MDGKGRWERKKRLQRDAGKEPTKSGRAHRGWTGPDLRSNTCRRRWIRNQDFWVPGTVAPDAEEHGVAATAAPAVKALSPRGHGCVNRDLDPLPHPGLSRDWCTRFHSLRSVWNRVTVFLHGGHSPGSAPGPPRPSSLHPLLFLLHLPEAWRVCVAYC